MPLTHLDAVVAFDVGDKSHRPDCEARRGVGVRRVLFIRGQGGLRHLELEDHLLSGARHLEAAHPTAHWVGHLQTWIVLRISFDTRKTHGLSHGLARDHDIDVVDPG